MAEAGVGKSRLFYEFKLKNRSGWMVIETVPVSHGKASAYLPVFDLLHGYFDIKPEDDSRKRREKVNGRIVSWIRRSRTPALACSACWGWPRATIHSLRWTRRSDGAVRRTRSSGFSYRKVLTLHP